MNASNPNDRPGEFGNHRRAPNNAPNFDDDFDIPFWMKIDFGPRRKNSHRADKEKRALLFQ